MALLRLSMRGLTNVDLSIRFRDDSDQGDKIPSKLLEFGTEPPDETEWRRLMAIRRERQRRRIRRTLSFPIHSQQARHAPGVDLSRLSLTVNFNSFFPREPLPSKLLHETPLPTLLLRQDLADLLHVKTTAGTHLKPESAPVDKAVTDPVNEILTEPRHSTPGDAEEDRSSALLKSAAVCPCDESEQRPDEALGRGAPNDEGEPSHNSDYADFEESDGPH
ncbi:hypothetical protein E4U58_002166 [Claviceps cyperi]|nr:hypothetical protein E4U58_002166 [Claviceps cyperi]